MFMDLIAKRFIPDLPKSLLRFLGMAPKPVTSAERAAQFPLHDLPVDEPVTIRWNSFQVPYVEARSDQDLAVAIGLVQAHLRGTQMSLMRLVSQGRLAESLGAPARKVDHALRVLDLCRATEQIERQLPEETRLWLEAFVRGLNHYQSLGHPRPNEMRWLGLKNEPWTVQDVIGVGRLVGADFNWLVLLVLLKHRDAATFNDIWMRLLEVGAGIDISANLDDSAARLTRNLVGLAKAGSNAVAVGPERSASGKALLACDPHLGLAMPNIWLLMGLKSPSYNCVGFMLSGLPFVCIGRNPELAWGGTNLRAASSDMFDLSPVSDDEIESQMVTLKTRFGREVKRKIRKSSFGTLLADARMFGLDRNDRTALRWVGHEVTDEISAFLRASRAADGTAFRAAFKGYGIPGQTMIYADSKGDIGKVIAAILPKRDAYHHDEFVKPVDRHAASWDELADLASQTDHRANQDGLIVSANDPVTDTPVPVGFLFDFGDRVRRLRTLAEEKQKITPGELVAMLRDTHSDRAEHLATRIGHDLSKLDSSDGLQKLSTMLIAWDGGYEVESKGALAFELLLTELLPILFESDQFTLWRETLCQWNFIAGCLEPRIDSLAPDEWSGVLRRAALLVKKTWIPDQCWGDVHRVQVAHTLANLPLIGKAYVLDDLPSPGSRQTLYKTSHGPVQGRHHSDFGTMACFSADLADLDANEFVMFGGQDEWMGSPSFADQIPLWQSGQTIRMPLRATTIAEEFQDVMILKPDSKRRS